MIPLNFKSEYPKTWFFDLDGTILEYNLIFSENRDELLPGVKDLWNTIPEDDYIILTTARPVELKQQTLSYLDSQGIRYNEAIFGIPRGERIVVNDDKPDGTITALAWRINRNKGFPQ